MQFVDLIGHRFGRLTVAALKLKATSRTPTIYICDCDCGARIDVRAGNLKNGHSKSCGCRRVETNAKSKNVDHGACVRHKMTPEYRAWSGMKYRCTNQDAPNWNDYGGRGIKVCDRWLNSFAAFLADVGPRPSPEHSLDRWPDNDGNYEPDNVRWATRSEQQLNKRPFKWKRNRSEATNDA
jgi:hypothetical protein